MLRYKNSLLERILLEKGASGQHPSFSFESNHCQASTSKPSFSSRREAPLLCQTSCHLQHLNRNSHSHRSSVRPSTGSMLVARVRSTCQNSPRSKHRNRHTRQLHHSSKGFQHLLRMPLLLLTSPCDLQSLCNKVGKPRQQQRLTLSRKHSNIKACRRGRSLLLMALCTYLSSHTRHANSDPIYQIHIRPAARVAFPALHLPVSKASINR